MARVKNWWVYHWKMVLLALVLAAIGVICAAQLLSRREPDIRVGYAATAELPPETASALTRALEGFCADRDGDGRVTVELEQFTVDLREGAAPAAENAYDADNWRQMVYAWGDCPVLAGLDLGPDGKEQMQGLYIGRCAPSDRADPDYAAAIDALWAALTAGASAGK